VFQRRSRRTHGAYHRIHQAFATGI
jgi:hypothetical protein